MTKPDFSQPSTWRGLAGLLALFGIAINPASIDQIAMGLGAVISVIEVIRNEWRR